MININELRIGNIYGCDSEGNERYLITDRNLLQIEKYPEQLYNLALSERMLIMLGFNKDDYAYSIKIDDNFDLAVYFDSPYPGVKSGVVYLNCEDVAYTRELPHINYVHQLQMLHYSLTGKELRHSFKFVNLDQVLSS